MTPFVPIPRSFFASAKWSAAAGEFTEREAFIDLCQRAAFTPGKLGFGYSSPDLQIGESEGSIRFLAKRWGWAESKVNRFLKRQEREGAIRRRSCGTTTAILVPAVRDVYLKQEVKHQPKQEAEHLSFAGLDGCEDGRNTNRNTNRNGKRNGTETNNNKGEGENGKTGKQSPLPPQAGDGSGIQPNGKKPAPTFPIPAIEPRLRALYSRRDSTPWNAKEIRAAKALRDLRIPPDDLLHDLALFRAAREAGWEYYRREPATLLNNWTGEVDKARQFMRGRGGNGGDQPKFRTE